MLARVVLAAFLLAVPAAQAADLVIRAVVVKSARVSGITLTTAGGAEKVQVTVLPTEEGGMRVVFTP